MADPQAINSKISKVDTTKPDSWVIDLESGHRLAFAISVLHKQFQTGDTVLVGFNDWNTFEGFALFCHYRCKHLVQDFIIRPDACSIDPPNMLSVYMGEQFEVQVDTNASPSDLLYIQRRSGGACVQVFFDQNVSDTINVSPSSGVAIGVDSEDNRPVFRFKK